MPVINLKGRFIFILFFHFNVVKPYKEVKIKELVYLNNLFSHFHYK